MSDTGSFCISAHIPTHYLYYFMLERSIFSGKNVSHFEDMLRGTKGLIEQTGMTR